MVKILAGNYAMMRTVALSQTARINNSYASKARTGSGSGLSGTFWYGSLYMLSFTKTNWLGGGYLISLFFRKGISFQTVFSGFISESNIPSKLESDIIECMEFLGLIKAEKKQGIIQKTMKKAKDMLTGGVPIK